MKVRHQDEGWQLSFSGTTEDRISHVGSLTRGQKLQAKERAQLQAPST